MVHQLVHKPPLKDEQFCQAWVSSFVSFPLEAPSLKVVDCVQTPSRKLCECQNMSKLWMSYFKLAAYWRMRTLESLDNVGLSLGIWSMRGSSKPNTTRRALAFLCKAWDFRLLSVVFSSTGFQVGIHRRRRIWSLGTWLRKTLVAVSVDNKLSISLVSASSKSFQVWDFNFTSLALGCRDEKRHLLRSRLFFPVLNVLLGDINFKPEGLFRSHVI